jgi:hypothetical protein
MISSSLSRRGGSAKTMAASLARSSEPSGLRTDSPNSAATAASPADPGATASRASASESTSTAPCFASSRATSDLPEPIPPVSPTFTPRDHTQRATGNVCSSAPRWALVARGGRPSGRTRSSGRPNERENCWLMTIRRASLLVGHDGVRWERSHASWTGSRSPSSLSSWQLGAAENLHGRPRSGNRSDHTEAGSSRSGVKRHSASASSRQPFPTRHFVLARRNPGIAQAGPACLSTGRCRVLRTAVAARISPRSATFW